MVQVKKDSDVIEINPLAPVDGSDENTIVEVDVARQLVSYEPQLPYSNSVENWLWLLGAAALGLLIYGLVSD